MAQLEAIHNSLSLMLDRPKVLVQPVCISSFSYTNSSTKMFGIVHMLGLLKHSENDTKKTKKLIFTGMK